MLEDTKQWIKKVPGIVQGWGISFIGLHYLYIISIGIVGSILVYPVRNIAYIDALFLTCCAATQGGLNTVDLNKLTLYQQIILYLIPMVTTPIFVHSFVVFLRLYWFEKYFAGIKQSSKIQSRMRRTATMARANTMNPQDQDIEMTPQTGAQHPKESPKESDNEDTKSTTPVDPHPHPPPPSDIKFGDLPQPQRNAPVAPRDMYTSINMMQRNRRTSDASEGEGPALVIKGPKELDEEHERQERAAYKASRPPSLASSSSLSRTNTDDWGNNSNTLTRSQSHNLGSSTVSVMEGVELGKRSHTVEGAVETNSDGHGPARLPSKFKRRKNNNLPRSHTFEQFLSNAKQRLRDREDTQDTRLARTMTAQYLSWEPTVGRNSQFVDLTPEQKEELGGVEYRALKLLAKVLVCYYVGFHLLAAILVLPWAVLTEPYRSYFRQSGFSPAWWAFFTCESGFNDVGFTLTPDSMSHFQQVAYIEIVLSFFMVIGNTGFPCLLRLIIWIMLKLSPEYGQTHESVAFLLDHPRRCFTLLFPSSATWWLFFILVVMNGVDLIFFIILDINNSAVQMIPVGYRILCGLFQAFATRTTGFSIVSLSDLHAGIQVSYMVMMYISVMPLAISIRRTNVYEEQSLGVYDQETDKENDVENQKAPSYISNHLRRQLSFDLWYIALGLFIITIAEGGRVGDEKQVSFDVFSILFEITSAYGTVGLSRGYPGSNTSFSGQFGVIGKLIIVAMLIRGRHRGLPYALDRAVMKPSERLQRHDSAMEQHPSKASNKLSGRPLGSAAVATGTNSSLRPKSSIGSGVNRLRRLSMGGLAPGPPPPRPRTPPNTTFYPQRPQSLSSRLSARTNSHAVED